MERKELQPLVGTAVKAALAAVSDTPDHRRRVARCLVRIAARIILPFAPPQAVLGLCAQAIHDELNDSSPSETPFPEPEAPADAN